MTNKSPIIILAALAISFDIAIIFLGLIANVDYQPDIKERDFYIFPYDMRHCVYPFNGPGFRRTLAANMDVQYDPIRNRGVS